MKKRRIVLPAFFLLLAVISAVDARGTEIPQWEEETPGSFSEQLPPPAPREEGWQDWEEDWTGSWKGAEEELGPGWEPWVEEEQESPPLWGPALTDPEQPAFPEEEPSAPSLPGSSAGSSQSSPASESEPRNERPPRDTTELSEPEVPGTDLPGILPRRVTEKDLPQKETPLWHRAADPNILWILLAAISLVILGLRILWGQDEGAGIRKEYDTRRPRQEKWGK